MAGDPSTGTIVMFGGRSDTANFLNDTWLWDGTTRTWSEVTSPSPVVYSAEMAYDPESQTVLLVGSVTGMYEDPSQTWSWNGRDKAWSLIPTATNPPSRFAESLAVDPVTGKVVMFGGEQCHMCNGVNETWLWDGENGDWVNWPTTSQPSWRHLGQMASHDATGKILLFGGVAGFAIKDTWLWDGVTGTWTQQSPLKSPCQRYGGAMAYHPGTATTVMFGGASNACLRADGSPGETWVWSGTNWARKT